MFVQDQSVIMNLPLKGREKAVMNVIALKAYPDTHQTANESYKTLAFYAGMSKETLEKALKSLEKKGLITVLTSFTKGQGSQVRVHMERVYQMVEPAPKQLELTPTQADEEQPPAPLLDGNSGGQIAPPNANISGGQNTPPKKIGGENIEIGGANCGNRGGNLPPHNNNNNINNITRAPAREKRPFRTAALAAGKSLGSCRSEKLPDYDKNVSQSSFEAWELALQECKHIFSWLQGALIGEITDDRTFIASKSPFYRDELKKNYRIALENSLSRHFNQNITIDFTVRAA